jgi:cytidylate kinase
MLIDEKAKVYEEDGKIVIEGKITLYIDNQLLSWLCPTNSVRMYPVFVHVQSDESRAKPNAPA